ncbi:DUF2971 domain-containing protein [Cypionkella psychrotolerans]|uniref:DUF2971 domain-containing protein n=1 Tax=Cypionkella psychrotolerans TaxID=1678131 RepID=UPI000AFF6A89|nr:DUF2971 domain-containing protein [Cypionkella psychrotolerans]
MNLPFLRFLLATTSLTQPGFTSIVQPDQRKRSASSAQTTLVRVRSHTDGSGPLAAIITKEQLNAPKITLNEIEGIFPRGVATITRHFCLNLLPVVRDGGFKFGTVSQYRPKDKALVGRFSDTREGLQTDVYESSDGLYHIEDGKGGGISGIAIEGADEPVVYEYIANDYCCCSSIGAFDRERASLIRDRGNPDIGAYAVYDLKKLLAAISSYVLETSRLKHLTAIAGKVQYGRKDRRIVIGGHTISNEEADRVNKWLNLMFVKAIDYSHEEELRILLIDPDRPGALAEEVGCEIWSDPRIVESIIDSGEF